MNPTRRQLFQGLLASTPLALLGGRAAAAEPVNLKISHQLPGGSATEGDFRDRLCRGLCGRGRKAHGRRAQVHRLSRARR